MISVTTDASKVIATLSKVAGAVEDGASQSQWAVAYEILRLSEKEVPHDKGTLQNSGTVQEGNGGVVVGYHMPYAARLHEHPEYRFQKGRKGKYLEDPILRNSRALGLKMVGPIADNINKAVK